MALQIISIPFMQRFPNLVLLKGDCRPFTELPFSRCHLKVGVGLLKMCFLRNNIFCRVQLILIFSISYTVFSVNPATLRAESKADYFLQHGNDPFFTQAPPGIGAEILDLSTKSIPESRVTVDLFTSLTPPGGDGLFGRYSVLVEDTVYLVIPTIAVMGVLWVSPESVSNWSDDDKATSFNGLLEKWKDNVIREGPRMDPDDILINVVGHPYFGSAYYIHARHYGYSRVESLVYSFCVSTFVYEYGIEGFAENPSIQDIFITPLGGYILGELLLPLEKEILKNDSKVLNSRILGALSLFLIDPIGNIVKPLKRLTHRIFGDDVLVGISPLVRHYVVEDDINQQSGVEHQYGFMLTFRW